MKQSRDRALERFVASGDGIVILKKGKVQNNAKNRNRLPINRHVGRSNSGYEKASPKRT